MQLPVDCMMVRYTQINGVKLNQLAKSNKILLLSAKDLLSGVGEPGILVRNIIRPENQPRTKKLKQPMGAASEGGARRRGIK